MGASSRSAGKKYAQVTNWKLSTEIPQKIKDMLVVDCVPKEFMECDLVFSGLDSSVAGEIEEIFAKKGISVFSNSKNHRLDADVPILIPAANADHVDVIPEQRKKHKYPNKGCIVTNANCSTTGLVVVLKPIHLKFGIEKCIVFTMQAISGAGYPGVSSIDIQDNVIPFVSGEEEKMQVETKKILGGLNESKDGFINADIQLSAHCNRVSVLDGHSECISIKLTKPATPEEIATVLNEYKPECLHALHSAPEKAIVVRTEEDRPQPRLDRDQGRGYTTTVGRIRKCNIFDIKLVLLSHNTILGAAGGSILNAELALQRGYI